MRNVLKDGIRLGRTKGFSSKTQKPNGFPFHFRHRVITTKQRAGTASAHIRYIGRAGTNDEPHEFHSFDKRDARAARARLDAHELTIRKNGRLLEKCSAMLPHNLTKDQAREAALDFARTLCEPKAEGGGGCAWWVGIHWKKGNWHMHIAFTDRDTITGRRVVNCSERGSTWRMRCAYAEALNRALEAAGKDERAEPRSFQKQGLSIEPSQHRGPWAEPKRKRAADINAKLFISGMRPVARAITRATRQLIQIATEGAAR